VWRRKDSWERGGAKEEDKEMEEKRKKWGERKGSRIIAGQAN
jgi:hypothetical protein